MKIFMKTKVCLVLEIILNIRDFMTLLIKKDCKIELKDGFRGKIIREFVGLKLKMYSLVTVDGGEIKKVKDVNKDIKNILICCLIRD